MKMENEIKADSDGTVKQILVEEGMPVDKDQELIVIE
jgi:biotin carboxyl carrier protein